MLFEEGMHCIERSLELLGSSNNINKQTRKLSGSQHCILNVTPLNRMMRTNGRREKRTLMPSPTRRVV